jgi:hypothetical protein
MHLLCCTRAEGCKCRGDSSDRGDRSEDEHKDHKDRKFF